MPVIGRSFGILIESIIFATDFSPASKSAAGYASNLAVQLHTNLIVAHGASHSIVRSSISHPALSLK